MRVALILLMAGLAGCASAPAIEHITVDESSARVRRDVRVLGAPNAALITQRDPVVARSCKRMSWDPDPSTEDAVAQLKIKAARIGANALTKVQCTPEVNQVLSTNCWASIVCRADAVTSR